MRLLLIAVAMLAALLLAACGDDDDGGGDDGGATEVNVTVKEFEVIPEADSAPAGDVTFIVENTGPDDPHELVIVQTDLAPDALPTNDDGSYDEAGEGATLIDEIEEFEVGATEQITLDLTAGSYVLLCNLVEEEEGMTESHYAEGMRTAFTVE